MQVLIIYTCTDLFSYDGFALQRQCLEGDYSKREIENIKKEYLTLFSGKRLSKISLTHLEVSPTGEVGIITNVQGENPLKSYKEINPAAVQAKAARAAKEKPTFIPTTSTEGAEIFWPVQAGVNINTGVTF